MDSIPQVGHHKGPGVAVALAATVAPAPDVYRIPKEDVQALAAAAGASASPPASNTGAFATACLIDCLRCTFPADGTALEKAQIMFGAGLEWTHMDRGGRNYENCLRRGHVSIYYGGNGGGVHVDVTGQGCRQLEAEGVIEGDGWKGFLEDLQAMGCTFPRVDWAFDDTEGHLNLDQMEQAVRAGNCATRFRQVRPQVGIRPSDGGVIGHTLYFGSRQSLMFVRVYNKHLEQLSKGEQVKEGHWVRTEVEAHDQGAAALVRKFVERGAEALAEVLRHYVDFKEEGSDSNKCRRATCSWWERFLSYCAKMPLGVAPSVKTLEETAKAVWRQWSAGLALLIASPAHGPRWFDQLVQYGEMRWKSKHISMLASALYQHDQPARSVSVRRPATSLEHWGDSSAWPRLRIRADVKAGFNPAIVYGGAWV